MRDITIGKLICITRHKQLTVTQRLLSITIRARQDIRYYDGSDAVTHRRTRSVMRVQRTTKQFNQLSSQTKC